MPNVQNVQTQRPLDPDRAPPGPNTANPTAGRVVKPGAALLIAVVAVALALGMGARAWWQGRDAPVPVPIAAAGDGTGGPTEPAVESPGASVAAASQAAGPEAVPTTTAGGQLVVDVVGQVRRPGIVRLPAGSRVVDAVEAAGGVLPGAAVELINLARPLVDGEQVLVPRPGQAVPTPGVGPGGGTGPSAGAGPAGAGGVLDLNTADEAQLDDLPGIGPVLAGRIVAWRTTHGRFSQVDELAEVGGIGEKLLAQLRPLVRV